MNKQETGYGSFKIVCISDTHNKTPINPIPYGDVLVHAGDFTFKGTVKETLWFRQYLTSLPHSIKIIISGNHDTCFDTENFEEIFRHYRTEPERFYVQPSSLFREFIYLEDSSLMLYGYKVWGTPWVSRHKKGAFSVKDDEKLRNLRESIPKDTDILISHGPCFGILDEDCHGVNVGCKHLLKRVEEIKPKLHIFGHIHEGHGLFENNGTLFVNAAICNKRYQPVNKPIVVELPILNE